MASILKVGEIKSKTGNDSISITDSGAISGLKIADGGTIKSASNTDAISISSSGAVTLSSDFVPATPLSHRNLIINGAMQVAQRATSKTGIGTSGYYTIDRFKVNANGLGTWTQEQSTDAPADFKYSLKMTCTTADSSPSSGDFLNIRHSIEGHNIAHLNYGTSDAKQLTLSFWIKSNKAGTIGSEIQTGGTSYERTENVTISANTWEYKTVSIPANTVATANEDNSTGINVYWWVNAGTNYKGTPTSTWGTGNSGRAGTLTSEIGTAVNDYIAITGVQLELGSVATPFENRSYADELRRCQRYCWRKHADSSGEDDLILSTSYNGDTANNWMTVPYPAQMRAKPTLGNASWGQGTPGSINEGLYWVALNFSDDAYYVDKNTDFILDAEL